MKPSVTLPGIVTTTLSRSRFELMGYWRSPDGMFFTFFFPVVMLLIFGVAFSGQGTVGPPGSEISMATLYLPAMITSGILVSGTQGLAIDIATDRQSEIIKRLSVTPLPVVSYFLGKFIQVLITSVAQAAVIILVAVTVFQVQLPLDYDSWMLFAGVFLLGLLTCSLLGIALSAIPRSTKSITAVVLPPVLLLQFISGVYLSPNMLPDWLLQASGVFPVKWIAQGMREVFLPEAWATLEPSGSWNTGWVFLALAIWAVFGIVLSKLTFRWARPL